MTTWTREKAQALLNNHRSFGTEGDTDFDHIGVCVMEGDGETILECQTNKRKPPMGLAPREMAELIAFVLNDYCREPEP